MKLRIPDLGDEVRSIEFLEQPDSLNELLEGGRRGDGRRFDSPVSVFGEVYLTGTDVHFSGSVRGEATCGCSRCLEEFRWPFERDFRFVIALVGSLGADEEPDVGLDTYDGDEVDLGRLAREQVLLALDVSALCSETCKGLCAQCGANRNREPCRCEAG